MAHLFDLNTATSIKTRINSLKANSPAQWGKMNAGQALEHCARGFKMASGELRIPRTLRGKIMGGLVKKIALGNDRPIVKNAPTAPQLVVADERNLQVAQQELCGLVDRFAAAGPKGCTDFPHPFFGRLTPDEWAELMYKHVDHHLRQFGA